MAVKLRELYELCDKKELKLIAGHKGLGGIVRWVHMVEGLEISLFMEQQELAFTTGIALKEKNELFELVKCSYDSQASGFVINIGPFIDKIPEEVIQFCNHNNFPLFEAPWSTYLAEIMRKFCYQITLSDRIEIELSAAFRNAIYYPNQRDLYTPQFEKNGIIDNKKYSVVLLDITDTKDLIIDSKRFSLLHKKIENLLIFNNKGIHLIELDNKFVFLFTDFDNLQIKTVINKLLEKFSSFLYKSEKFIFSIGNIVDKVQELNISYHNAIKTLAIQKKRDNYNSIIEYENLGITKILLAANNESILKSFYKEKLEPLVIYDEINGTDFLMVLKSYLKNDGSIKAVAEELYYHKNTICYKIKKIEEISNCPLSTLEGKQSFGIALLIMELL